MTQYKITAPKKLDATVALPASKSISNRALIIYALSGGHLLPQNLSDCDDTEVIINAIRHMPEVIDIKAAGTAMRFMTAYLSVMRGTHTLTGTERMKKRPIKILVDALRSLGAEIDYLGKEGFPPLSITGTTLSGGILEMSGSVSSQYISAVLMIGPMLDTGLELRLTGEIISRPYIDLTLYMMNESGADAEWTSADTITIKPVRYKTKEYLIENDWSGASYWYEMMALTDDPDAKLLLTGLKDGSKQGDSVARYIFSMLGVRVKEVEKATDSDYQFQRTLSAKTGVRFRQLPRPCPDIRCDMCCERCEIPFQGPLHTEDQRDRPHRGTEERDEEAGLRDRESQRQ